MADYSGWPNRETWNVMLWLNNDEPAYREYRAAVQSHRGRLTGKAAKTIARRALGASTPDGVSLSSPKIRWGAIAEAMRENPSKRSSRKRVGAALKKWLAGQKKNPCSRVARGKGLTLRNMASVTIQRLPGGAVAVTGRKLAGR